MRVIGLTAAPLARAIAVAARDLRFDLYSSFLELVKRRLR
jgi:hypothetical protein